MIERPLTEALKTTGGYAAEWVAFVDKLRAMPDVRKVISYMLENGMLSDSDVIELHPIENEYPLHPTKAVNDIVTRIFNEREEN